MVERADAIRSGGYPIDVRGTAIDVVERMGVLPQLRAAHVDTGKLRFVDADGNTIATITPEYLAGGTTDRHIELPRGELASILYGLTRDGQARYRFNDSIEALHDDGAGVRRPLQKRGGTAVRYRYRRGWRAFQHTRPGVRAGSTVHPLSWFLLQPLLKAEQCWPLT